MLLSVRIEVAIRGLLKIVFVQALNQFYFAVAEEYAMATDDWAAKFRRKTYVGHHSHDLDNNL